MPAGSLNANDVSEHHGDTPRPGAVVEQQAPSESVSGGGARATGAPPDDNSSGFGSFGSGFRPLSQSPLLMYPFVYVYMCMYIVYLNSGMRYRCILVHVHVHVHVHVYDCSVS